MLADVLVGRRARLQGAAKLWLGVAVLVELSLVVGQQIKHRSGLLLAEVIIESRSWLGVLDVDDDLGVVPNGLSSTPRTGGIVISPFLFDVLASSSRESGAMHLPWVIDWSAIRAEPVVDCKATNGGAYRATALTLKAGIASVRTGGRSASIGTPLSTS
jgi:hypothetical protein